MIVIFQWLDFLIDLPSLESWLKTNYGDKYVSMRTGTNISIRFKQDPTITIDSVKASVNAQLDTLTKASELAKRNLKSRMLGSIAKSSELLSFQTAVKNRIASKDITTLTVAEKKMLMGLSLSNDEFDTLTTS